MKHQIKPSLTFRIPKNEFFNVILRSKYDEVYKTSKKTMLSVLTLFFSLLSIAQIEPKLPFDYHNNNDLLDNTKVTSVKISEFEPQFGFNELDSLSKLDLIKNIVEIHFDSTKITKLIKEDREYRSKETHELLYDNKGRILEKISNSNVVTNKEIYNYNDETKTAFMFSYRYANRRKNLTKYDRATKYTFKNDKIINEVIDNKHSKSEIIYKYNHNNDLIYLKGQYAGQKHSKLDRN